MDGICISFLRTFNHITPSSDARDGGYKGKTPVSNPNRPKITCHICDGSRHPTNRCFQLRGLLIGKIGNALAMITFAPQFEPHLIFSPLFSEFGTTHYLTSDAANIDQHVHYNETYRITIGNGYLLAILNHGHYSLIINFHKSHVSNILHAPHVSKNIVYVHHLCVNNRVCVKFDANSFIFKKVQKVLVYSKAHHRLYNLNDGATSIHTHDTPSVLERYSSIAHVFNSTTSVDINDWYKRLAHLFYVVLRKFVQHSFVASMYKCSS